jgi:hypothetical protein
MLYVLLPAVIFFIIYRVVRGPSEPPDADDPGASDADTAQRTSPR